MKKVLFILSFILLFVILNADIGEEVSALFTMDTANPIVNVLNPNGGETLISNQQTAISWTVNDGHLTGNTINIKFSPNNGSNYQTISTGESNDGTYNWTVPYAYTEFALMKISATDDFGNYAEDISDAVFAIMWEANFGVSSIFAMDTVDPALNLTSPNGGEEWYIGSTHDILWSTSDSNLPTNPVDIEFATGGTNFTSLAENEFNDGIYAWEIPTTTTEQGRIKIIVIDTFGNISEDISASTFIIDYVPPQKPQNVTIDISNGIDAIISWNAVTHNTENQEITHDGYIVLYNEVPTEEGNDNFYYFLTATSDLSVTHHRVVEFRDQQFYRVIVYIDHNGRINDYLANLNLSNAQRSLKRLDNKRDLHHSEGYKNDHSEGKITWAELKKELEKK